ncbi:MAG: sulfatase [Burkholderiaceae bacterium]
MSKKSGKQPNILIIYPDQLRADCVGYAGNSVVKTPNIDRLALEGVQFSNAYVAFPICCPFRASLLTGKHAQNHGMIQNHFPLRGDQTFLAQVLRNAGYHTGYVGKWHLEGGPKPGFVPIDRRFGFESFVGFNRGHEYMKSIYFNDDGVPHYSKRYEPDYQTDQLIEFIETSVAKNDGKPFFGYVSYGPPHFPMNMPEYLRTLYKPEDVPLPPGVPNAQLQQEVQDRRFNEYCGGVKKTRHKSHTAGDTKPAGEVETEAEIRQFIAEYYGMIHNIDNNIGVVLNRLDALGIADDTMVVFLSDHGDMMGQHGYFCGVKAQAYRGAMQVPFVIRYPANFPGGVTVDHLVDVATDTMPTLLEMCGIDIPAEVDGVSYLPLLNGSGRPTRDAVMYQLFKQNDGNVTEFTPYAERGIRTREWLYVRHKNKRVLLFDLKNDYHEMNNLVDDAQYSVLMDEFDARIQTHMDQTGDHWDMAADFPPPDFLTHDEAKVYLEEQLLPSAVIVP